MSNDKVKMNSNVPAKKVTAGGAAGAVSILIVYILIIWDSPSSA